MVPTTNGSDTLVWWMCSVQRECTSHREEIDVHPLSHSSTVNKVGKLSHWVVTFWFCSYHTLSAFVATQSGTSSLNMRRTLLFWLISGGKIESNKSPGNLYYVRASLIYSKIMAIEPVDFFLFSNFTWTDKSHKSLRVRIHFEILNKRKKKSSPKW